jgi:hypothetical protein
MPRYFFHLEGGERIADKRGHDLPDDTAARREAKRIAGALRRRRRERIWRVIVTNEGGHEVTKEPRDRPEVRSTSGRYGAAPPSRLSR